MSYRGRLAPTPTGYLHLGHAATFYTAFGRARSVGGQLLLRIEDLDPRRCRSEYVTAAMDDLAWLGIDWHGKPLFQSRRRDAYLAAWKRLRDGGWIYPCRRSRRDVAGAAVAPHAEEPVFPAAWRRNVQEALDYDAPRGQESGRRQPLGRNVQEALDYDAPAGVNWRFRVPDGEIVSFVDGRCGPLALRAGVDFGDFVVWNRDDVPAYELAVVVDDLAMGITEIVRGEDLLTSTARQILLARALGSSLPVTYHTPLLVDSEGRRLAKRSGGSSLRELRAAGKSAAEVLELTMARTVRGPHAWPAVFAPSAGGSDPK